ncbi:helix-turn-helix domain-containing protein [Lacticaseibacillus saniviri]
MDIGQKIRNLRIQKNLTQEELGERTDLSKGYISQLEHNQSSPSMETFFDILAVLGQTPSDFFQEEKPIQLVYPVDEQTEYHDETKGYTIRWLVPESNENEMEPVAISLDPHGTFKTFEPSAAETFIYVTAGIIGLTLGEKVYRAKAGETIYFHASENHQIQNLAKGVSRCILVATASYL